MTPPSSFVKTIDLKLADRMVADLIAQGFTLTTPQYTKFSAAKKGISCTLYTSGKLVVQGKNMAEFIEFYLEPLLHSFTFTYPQLENLERATSIKPETGIDAADDHLFPHIGIDESGKGDYFGPLCVAGVYADVAGIGKLKTLGVKDSKTFSDAAILKLGKAIKAICTYHIVKINPQKYNELYDQFKNLNNLLAWGHATVIEQLVAKTQCSDIVIDQFANEKVVLTALSRKKLKLNVTQRHRAEADVVVAAASILARETFLLGLAMLGEEFSMKLPKGASAATIAAGRQFVAKYGREELEKIGKLHFKTTSVIL